MVRFIIRLSQPNLSMSDLFTFQYGQIYYREDNAVRRRAYDYLHSNMVRFIIDTSSVAMGNTFEFTFQYGQIYYFHMEL